MERVTYQLERSLPSLDLLATSGVFSRDELRALTSQRQQHESHLIRRVALWEDFEAYIAFEERTEKLRLLRCRGLDLAPATMIQFRSAYTARVISVYERALRKFKSQLHVWTAYISWAKERGMRVVLGRVLARALAMHPSKTELWVMAADQELNGNGSATGARALLQRGLRINKPAAAPSTRKGKERQSDDGSDRPHKKSRVSDTGNRYALATASTSQQRLPPSLSIPSISESQERSYLALALEYVRMELVFMERLRRRWAILGIDAEGVGADEAVAAAERVEEQGEDGDREEALEENEAMQEQAMEAAQMPSDDEDGEAKESPAAPADNSVTAAQKRAEESRASAAAQLPVLQGAIVRLAIRSAVDAIQLPKEGDVGSSKAAHSAALGYRLAFLLAVRRLLYAFPFVDGHLRKGSGQVLRDSLVADVNSLLKHAVGEASTGRSEGSAETAFLQSADTTIVAKLSLWATSSEAAEELESGEKLKEASHLVQMGGNELDQIFADLASYLAGESQDGGPVSATNALLVQQVIQAAGVRLQQEDVTLPPNFVQAFKQMASWQDTLLSDCEGKNEKRLARAQASRLAALQSLLLLAVRARTEEDASEPEEGAESSSSPAGSPSGLSQLVDALQSQIFDTATRRRYLTYEIAAAYLGNTEQKTGDPLNLAYRANEAIKACEKTEEALGEGGTEQSESKVELWHIFLDAKGGSLEDEDWQDHKKDVSDRHNTLLHENLAALFKCPESLSLWARVIALVSEVFAKRNKRADRWAWLSLNIIVDRSSHLLQTCSDPDKREQRQKVHDNVLVAILDLAQDLRETRSAKTAAQAVEMLQRVLLNDSCGSAAFWLQYIQRAVQRYRLLKKDASMGQLVLSDEKKKKRQIDSQVALKQTGQQIDQLFQKILLVTAQDAGWFVEVRREWLKHLLQDRGAAHEAIAAFEACRRDAKAFSPAALRRIEEAWEYVSSGLASDIKEEEEEEEEEEDESEEEG